MTKTGTVFFIIRHAAHTGTVGTLLGRNQRVNLSEVGLRQAAAVGDVLAPAGIERVISSPSIRAKHTARILGRKLAVPVESDDALDEVDFGHWTGRGLADLAQEPEWVTWNERRSTATTPAGDSMRRVQDRAVALLRDLHHRSPDSRIAVVTHAEIIRSLILYCRSMPLDDWSGVDVAMASVRTIECIDEPTGTAALRMSDDPIETGGTVRAVARSEA